MHKSWIEVTSNGRESLNMCLDITLARKNPNRNEFVGRNLLQYETRHLVNMYVLVSAFALQ